MLALERSSITFGKREVSPTFDSFFRSAGFKLFDRFLGGTSGCNGTLCIRGSREDYNAWDLEGWSGEEMFKYMSKVVYA